MNSGGTTSPTIDTRFDAIDAALIDVAEVVRALTGLCEKIVDTLTPSEEDNELTKAMQNIEKLLTEILDRFDNAD